MPLSIGGRQGDQTRVCRSRFPTGFVVWSLHLQHQRPATAATLAQDIAEIKAQLAKLLALIEPQAEARDPSIAGFCQRKGISKSHYLNLRRAGKGPRETAIGTRRTISEAAEADWDRRQEAEAAAIEAERAEKRAARVLAAHAHSTQNGEAPHSETSP